MSCIYMKTKIGLCIPQNLFLFLFPRLDPIDSKSSYYIDILGVGNVPVLKAMHVCVY